MSELIVLTIGGKPVLVEPARSDNGQARPLGADDRVKEKIEESFEASLSSVIAMGGAVKDALKKSGATAGEVTIGLKFTAKGSVFVAETSGEASLNVKLSFALG